MNKAFVKKNIFSSSINLDDPSLHVLMQSAEIRKSHKGTVLITEGKRSDFLYILVRGSAKSYYYKDAKQICLWFAFDNDCISTISTYERQISNETVELLEDSEFIQFNMDHVKELSHNNLAVSNLILTLIKEHALFLEYKLNGLQFMTSEERYHKLVLDFPEILQKISLTDIASYLGVSRETLSRIRA